MTRLEIERDVLERAALHLEAQAEFFRGRSRAATTRADRTTWQGAASGRRASAKSIRKFAEKLEEL